MSQDFLPSSDEITPMFSDPKGSGRGRERIKHVLIGSPRSVQGTINKLHLLDYVERHNWSKLVPAGELGESNEVMSVLIRYPIFE